MKICFLLERGSPPRRNAILAEVVDRLGRLGIMVQELYPEEELLRIDQLAHDADLYLLKSDTEFAFSLAMALECQGKRVLNRCDAVALAKNKVLATITLLRAGIPTPQTGIAEHPSAILAQLGAPLILKPYRGYHGVGITVATTAAEIRAAPPDPDLVFAQRYLATARKDLKIFVIGDEVFGVRKPFARDSFTQAGEPTPLSPDIQEMARQVGQAFGLELYGLDMAEDTDGVCVIDVNYFPGYRGVPDAAQRLTDYILKSVDATELSHMSPTMYAVGNT